MTSRQSFGQLDSKVKSSGELRAGNLVERADT
jgi:hypothetical protein